MSIIEWFRTSHRWQHLAGGVVLGLFANDLYCAGLVGLSTAAALEFKDYQYGGRPDLWDFALTLSGVQIGFAIRVLTLKLF